MRGVHHPAPFWIMACCLALSGCAVGPAYKRPVTAVPAAWTTAGVAGEWPAAQWWHAFADLELDRLEDQALANNHDLKAAVARISQAAAQARIAGADLNPMLTVEAESGRAKPFSKGGQQTVQRYNYHQLGLTASYVVDLFGENRSKAQAGLAALNAARFDGDAVRLALSAAVANSYFELSAVDARMKIAQDMVDMAKTTVRLLEIQRDNGSASGQQLAQQRSELATIEANLATLETQRRQVATTLALLVGVLPQGLAVSPAALESLATPTPPAGLPSELLKHRPDVARAEAALVGANADVRAATAALYPQISLTAQGGYGSLALSQIFQPASSFYNLFAGLTAPLFEGGRLKGRRDYAEARYDELTETYQQAVLAAFADTQNALDAQQQTSLGLERRAESSRQAMRAAQLADVQYRAGAISYLVLLDSQRTAFAAQDALAQARLTRLQSSVAVYQALGGGWSVSESASLPN